MTNTIADIEEADVILITGSNTTENHPVLSSFVKRVVTRRGAKLIVVDPRRIKMTEFAEYWIRPNLGTDVAWINGMMHVIIKEGLHAKAFIEERTENYVALKDSLAPYTPQHTAEITGLDPELLVLNSHPNIEVRLFNPAAERICGYRGQEVVGRMNVRHLYPEGSASRTPCCSRGWPSTQRVAMRPRSTPVAFSRKGTVREARGLISST